jgi:hypothetical protein
MYGEIKTIIKNVSELLGEENLTDTHVSVDGRIILKWI